MKTNNRQRIIALLNAYTHGKSGGDICFIEIFKRLPQFDLFVVTPKLGRGLCEREGLHAQYFITTSESDFKHTIFTYFVRSVLACIKFPPQQPYDILYGTSDTLPDIFPILLRKIFYRGSVRWVQKIFHIIPYSRFIPSVTQRISFFFIKRFADTVILDNALLSDTLVSFGFQKDKIKVNHLGIDVKKIQSISPATAGFDAVFMGRIHKSKGVYDVVKIWSLVIKELPQATLGIIGSGNKHQLEFLQQAIVQKNLQQHIRLLGYLDDKDAFGIIKASKLFVFPSHEEGFGIAIGEALASMLPTITYDLPIFHEIYNDTIIKIPSFNIPLFAEKIIQLLRDHSLRETLSQKGYQFVQNMSWEEVASREKKWLLMK